MRRTCSRLGARVSYFNAIKFDLPILNIIKIILRKTNYLEKVQQEKPLPKKQWKLRAVAASMRKVSFVYTYIT